MTTFASRAETLLNRLGQMKSEQRDVNARAKVERVRTRAVGAGEKLAAISAADTELRQMGVVARVREGLPSEAGQARRALRSAASAVTGAAATDVATRVGAESVDEALKTAEKIANELLTNLNRAVDRRRLAERPAGVEADIAVYPGVMESLVVRLQGVQRRLNTQVDKVAAQDLANRLREILADVETWQHDHPLLDEVLERHHPEIKDFLRRAATAEGAPWELITPRVREWLGDARNTVDLRVVLRS